jgi:CCR4-NOT transcription complex subunit 1
MQLPVVSLAALPGNHEVRRIIREVAALATTGDRQRVPLGLSQKITQLLYKTQVPLARELYAALLHQFCKDHDEVAKEVIPWLVESPDEVCSMCCKNVNEARVLISTQRKYNVPVTIVLLKAGLFLVEQQDAQLALFLGTDPKPSLQNYAAGLVRECVFGSPPTAIQKHFSRTIDMFMRLSASARATEE